MIANVMFWALMSLMVIVTIISIWTILNRVYYKYKRTKLRMKAELSSRHEIVSPYWRQYDIYDEEADRYADNSIVVAMEWFGAMICWIGFAAILETRPLAATPPETFFFAGAIVLTYVLWRQLRESCKRIFQLRAVPVEAN
jgi:hypothetical protein